MRRLLVLEVNEVPLRVLRWYAERQPDSHIARLLDSSEVGQSDAAEELPRDLYPSQSWATLAMGVPYSEHCVFWYGDAKPERFPLYWQAAANANVSTGIFGTLHSSPLNVQCQGDAFRFAIPDPFANEPDTIPSRMSGLQKVSLSMTRANSRAVTDTSPWRSYAAAVAALARTGIRPRTAMDLARMAAEVAMGRINKERLRVGQFHLMTDQFMRLAERTDPELSVLFSNHLASSLHRYWYTIFPEDWDSEIYSNEWVERFADEIPYALRSFDLWLGRLMAWVEETERTLLLISSMGQTGGAPVHTEETSTLTLVDPKRFACALGLEGNFSIGNAMVPQMTFCFESADDAGKASMRLREAEIDRMQLHVDRHQNAITVTYAVYSPTTPDASKIEINGTMHHLADVGLNSIEVSEHRAAVHHPHGSVVVYNSPTASVPSKPFNYMGIAPAILESLGVEALPHHRKTDLVL